jgi:hypothetical protein
LQVQTNVNNAFALRHMKTPDVRSAIQLERNAYDKLPTPSGTSQEDFACFSFLVLLHDVRINKYMYIGFSAIGDSAANNFSYCAALT